jgi:8-oxo-dGTP pyrophosphatase MutT (NUDIX family)
MPIYDVFQKGLIRGAEHLPYDPEKAYAYVEHPVEGWRVYLRNAVFLQEAGTPADRFLVFRNSKKGSSKGTWEPPKGQMEGKDLLRRPSEPLVGLLVNALMREVEEEAHITDVQSVKYTGLVFQSKEKDFPENWFFQYHIFQATVSPTVIKETFEAFDWMKQHPKAVARWRRDRKETDAVAWFHPKRTPLNPRWCPTIVFAYLKNYNT